MPSKVSDAAAEASMTVSLYSDVWDDFEFNAGHDGGTAASATWRWCDKTLCAGGKNGTSHLRRHANNKSCQARAEERRRQPTAASSGGDQEPEESFYFVDGFNIPQVFDELVAMGLVHIDHEASEDAHFWPSLPLAANSSSRRFFQKTRERKRTESNKRCIPDGFIFQDQQSAKEDLRGGFKEKKLLADSSIHGDTVKKSGDYSCGNNQ